MSTARQTLRDNLFTTIEAWRLTWNAAQTIDRRQINQSYAARPATIHPPCIYIGAIAEVLQHMGGRAGVRERTFTVAVAVVRGLYSNEEAMDWLDAACDSLLDYLSERPWAISSSSNLTPVSAEDVELDLGGGTVYAGTVITSRYDYRDARPVLNP